MEKFSSVEIKGNGLFSQVFIDGNRIHGVRDYELTHRTGGVSTLTLTMNTMNLTVDGLVALASKDYPDEEMIFLSKEYWKNMTSSMDEYRRENVRLKEELQKYSSKEN